MFKKSEILTKWSDNSALDFSNRFRNYKVNQFKTRAIRRVVPSRCTSIGVKYAFELAVDLWDRQVIYWLVYVILDTLEFFNKIWQHLWLHFVAIKATENMLRTRTENKNKIYKVMVEFCFLWPKSYLLYESFKAKLFSIMPKQLK